ncbi:hypothetical protein Bca4012_026320 [Brassica carinata]
MNDAVSFSQYENYAMPFGHYRYVGKRSDRLSGGYRLVGSPGCYQVMVFIGCCWNGRYRLLIGSSDYSDRKDESSWIILDQAELSGESSLVERDDEQIGFASWNESELLDRELGFTRAKRKSG